MRTRERSRTKAKGDDQSHRNTVERGEQALV